MRGGDDASKDLSFVAVPHEIAFFSPRRPQPPFSALGGEPFLTSKKQTRSTLSQVLSEHFPGVELAHDIRSLQSLPEGRRTREKRAPPSLEASRRRLEEPLTGEKKYLSLPLFSLIFIFLWTQTKKTPPRESTSSSPASPASTSPGRGSGPGSTAGLRGWCAPGLLFFFLRFSFFLFFCPSLVRRSFGRRRKKRAFAFSLSLSL